MSTSLRPRIGALSILLAFFCLPGGESVATAAAGKLESTANADIYGRWKLSRVLDYADITSLTERQAHRLLGTAVLIRKDSFVINGELCETPSYGRTVEETARTMREKGHVSSVRMGLPDMVTVIDAGCTDIFLKRPGVIVVQWDGFYFEAVRQGY